MKMNMVLGKKAGLFLVFICLFSVNSCQSKLVVVESVLAVTDVKQSLLVDPTGNGNNGKTEKGSMRLCQGIKNANTTEKVVALTFDDGPHKKYTGEILEILNRYKIKATFFFIGKNVAEYPSLVKAVHAAGHIIGNHSYSHHYSAQLSDAELTAELIKTSSLIYGITQNYPLLFRPPYGSCSNESAQMVRSLGFKTIMWSSTADDCHVDRITSGKIAAGILRLVKPGAIIALHDGGGNREKTAKALPVIIESLKIAGYKFLTIPELLDIKAYFSCL